MFSEGIPKTLFASRKSSIRHVSRSRTDQRLWNYVPLFFIATKDLSAKFMPLFQVGINGLCNKFKRVRHLFQYLQFAEFTTLLERAA
mmetsp:Transcript_1669/g.3918  ORF Transcript_1669/g.3918 Transcript_1669/m.3918 type:complete len:87 (+) Transcript_1669:85-345(+)